MSIRLNSVMRNPHCATTSQVLWPIISFLFLCWIIHLRPAPESWSTLEVIKWMVLRTNWGTGQTIKISILTSSTKCSESLSPKRSETIKQQTSVFRAGKQNKLMGNIKLCLQVYHIKTKKKEKPGLQNIRVSSKF